MGAQPPRRTVSAGPPPPSPAGQAAPRAGSLPPLTPPRRGRPGCCESTSSKLRQEARDPWMTGGKRAQGTSWFTRHLPMKHGLGIQSIGGCMVTWWDLKLNCIAIEGQDFAQHIEEGGADQFVLIPDSDEERGAKGSSLLSDDDEYAPEMEPQDVTVSTITGPSANQGRQRLGTMLHEWLQLISDVKLEETTKVEMESGKLEMETTKVEMERDKLDSVKLEKEELDNVKLEKEELDNVKLEKEELDHMASFSDIEIDDEACSF